MQDEYSGKGNTSLAAIFAVGVFWRVIKFFDFKEKGLSNGLAFFRTLAFMEVPERFVQSEQEKKRKKPMLSPSNYSRANVNKNLIIKGRLNGRIL